MVDVAPSLRERKKRATREHLLHTAITLIEEHGFDQLTVEQIAAAADVGKGTIYNYFATKEDIVVAFFVDLERRVQQRMARWTTSRTTLEEVLTSFLRCQFRLKRPHLRFVRIFFAQMFARPEQMSRYIVELQDIIDPPLIRLFTSLQGRGVLRADIPIPALLLQFKTFHFGLSATWALEGPPWRGTSHALSEQVKLFCSGLEPQ